MAIRINNVNKVFDYVINLDDLTGSPFTMTNVGRLCSKKEVSFGNTSFLFDKHSVDLGPVTSIYKLHDNGTKEKICDVSGTPYFECSLNGDYGVWFGSSFFSYSQEKVTLDLPVIPKSSRKILVIDGMRYLLARTNYYSVNQKKYYPRFHLYSLDRPVNKCLLSDIQDISFRSQDGSIIIDYSDIIRTTKQFDKFAGYGSKLCGNKYIKEPIFVKKDYSYFAGLEKKTVFLDSLLRSALLEEQEILRAREEERKKKETIIDIRLHYASLIRGIIDELKRSHPANKFSFYEFRDECYKKGICPELKKCGGIVFNLPEGAGVKKLTGGAIGFDYRTLSFTREIKRIKGPAL